jgi:hypothetical protein
MGTGDNTLAAANTKIAVVIHDLSGTVIAHFCGAYGNATVAINTILFHDLDNRPQGHFSIHGRRIYQILKTIHRDPAAGAIDVIN